MFFIIIQFLTPFIIYYLNRGFFKQRSSSDSLTFIKGYIVQQGIRPVILEYM
jgi:hypothetical protein